MKRRKILFSIIILVLLMGIGLLFRGCTEKYNPKFYVDSQTVLDLFHENQEEFDDMITMLGEKEEMYSEMWEDIGHQYIFGPYGQNTTKYLKKYLTTKEYEQLTTFFETYRPYEIAYKGDYWYFVFLKEGGNVSFYYFDVDNEEIEKRLIYIEQNGECRKLSDNWYYQERLRNQ